MTPDPAAVAAVAEALHPATCEDAPRKGLEHLPALLPESECVRVARALLTHTPQQRRALAAAFLDVEALAAALARAGAVGSRRSEASMVNIAAVILAALKETQ